MYKQAARQKLRFATEKGTLTTEQLWDLPRSVISRTIQSVNEILKQQEPTGDLDFLTDDTTIVKDPENKLRFDILKDVYLTKKEEAEARRDAAKIKAHNEKIDTLIAKKQDEELESLSVKDLEKMRK